MSTLTIPSFNPFTFANRLKDAGVPEKQAVAEAELLHDVLSQQTQAVSALENQVKTLAADTKRDAALLATKGDVTGVGNELRTEISEVRSELGQVREDVVALRGDVKLLYWMLGTLIGLATASLTGVAALVLRLYA